MSQDGLVIVMTVAVVVSSVALVVQAGMMFGMFRSIKAIRDQIEGFRPRAESVLQSAELTLTQSRKQLAEITGKTNIILDSTRTQLERVDSVLAEASERARSQMARIEIVLDDTIGKVHETVTVLNNGVMKPLRELNGISAGLRAAFTHFMAGRRPNVAQATSDEEMFI